MIASVDQMCEEGLEPLGSDERLTEIAEILARGYLRLRAKRSPDSPQAANISPLRESEKSSESRTISLDNLAPQSDECVQLEMFRETGKVAKEANTR